MTAGIIVRRLENRKEHRSHGAAQHRAIELTSQDTGRQTDRQPPSAAAVTHHGVLNHLHVLRLVHHIKICHL